MIFALSEALDELEQALHLFLCANADADETWADVLGAVAEENAACVKLLTHLRAAGAEISEEKISGARKGFYVEFAKFFFEPGAGAKNVFDVALHYFGVANGGFGSRERGYVDGKWSCGAPKDRERFSAGDDGSEAKTGESSGFREGAGNEEMRVLIYPQNDGDAGKFGVGLVEDDGGVRGGLQNCFDRFLGQKSAGGIVGIADKQHARFGFERGENAGQWKFHVGVVALDRDFGASDFTPVAIHGEGGFADDNGSSGVDESIEEKAERVIATVGEKKLFGRDLKVTSEAASAAVIFGVHR